MSEEDYKRRLTYRFYTLPFRRQVIVAIESGLLTDEDSEWPSVGMFDVLYERAEKSETLWRLWLETERQHRYQEAGTGSK